MRLSARTGLPCPNETCRHRGSLSSGNIVPHGYNKTRKGRRRRYRCTTCGRTFGATTATPYSCLHHSSELIERVCLLHTEGFTKAAIARRSGVSWSTVARWLARNAQGALPHEARAELSRP